MHIVADWINQTAVPCFTLHRQLSMHCQSPCMWWLHPRTEVALPPPLARSPYTSPKALLEYAMIALFAVDIGFKFRLAFYDEEVLVDDVRAIAVRYLRCAGMGRRRV